MTLHFGLKQLCLIGIATSALISTACSTTKGKAGLRSERSTQDSLVSSNQNSNTSENDSFEESSTEKPIAVGNYFDWPVDKAVLSRGFLPNKKRPHLGIDLAAPKGTPILAAHGGTVIYTGRDFKGFGKMVMIEGKKGWATLYAHLSKIDVREGDKIQQGDIIGKMGRTGRASGVHLHFEIRQASGPVDPLLFLPRVPSLAQHQDAE